MYTRCWQNLDSITCLLGTLKIIVFVYVHKTVAESRLCHLFIWKSNQSGFCLHMYKTFRQKLDSIICLLGTLKILMLLMYVRF